MGELTVLFHEGRYRSAWLYVREDGGNPVRDFIETHIQSRPNEMNRLIRTIKFICDDERPHREKFRHEQNGIYAIKAHQARVYGFQDGHRVIMCHAVFKKRDRAGKEDLKKTDRIRDEYKRRKDAWT